MTSKISQQTGYGLSLSADGCRFFSGMTRGAAGERLLPLLEKVKDQLYARRNAQFIKDAK